MKLHMEIDFNVKQGYTEVSKIARSTSANNPESEISTLLLTLPRTVLAELLMHRVFSRSGASTRAIPIEKQVQNMLYNMYIPEVWFTPHRGMQGSRIITDTGHIEELRHNYIGQAINSAKYVISHSKTVSKGILGRILEPFTFQKELVTATEWDNFLKLRGVKEENIEKLDGVRINSQAIIESGSLTEAEINMTVLAEQIRRVLDSPAEIKQWGEWHMPFYSDELESFNEKEKLLICSARCARLSYLNFNGKSNPEDDLRLSTQKLLPLHHSNPFEHCAKLTPYSNHSFANFKGWKSFRYVLEI